MRKKNIISILLIATILSGMSVVNAFADTTLIETNSGTHTFNSRWTGQTISKNNSTLSYGFDTTLINEDYAYANSIGYRHRSKIKNGNGLHYGPKKWANDGRSDIEVRHKGSKIYYYCMNVTS